MLTNNGKNEEVKEGLLCYVHMPYILTVLVVKKVIDNRVLIVIEQYHYRMILGKPLKHFFLQFLSSMCCQLLVISNDVYLDVCVFIKKLVVIYLTVEKRTTYKQYD